MMQVSIIGAQRSGSQVIDLAIASTLWGGALYNANHHGPPMSMSISSQSRHPSSEEKPR
jgi:hypothetical protein